MQTSAENTQQRFVLSNLYISKCYVLTFRLGTPRAYASKIADERALPTLVEMLGELMRLQERSKDDKNARARRRLVMGLREVARGIRSHKVKMVVMASKSPQLCVCASFSALTRIIENLQCAQASEP